MNDDFVCEVWEGISMEIARGWHERVMRDLTVPMEEIVWSELSEKRQRESILKFMYDIRKKHSSTDESVSYPENPEIWTVEEKATEPRKAVSRCCRSKAFHDGERWICEKCRVGTKVVWEDTLS
jgi:hypothetical protein